VDHQLPLVAVVAFLDVFNRVALMERELTLNYVLADQKVEVYFFL